MARSTKTCKSRVRVLTKKTIYVGNSFVFLREIRTYTSSLVPFLLIQTLPRFRAFLVDQTVKPLPAMQATQAKN